MLQGAVWADTQLAVADVDTFGGESSRLFGTVNPLNVWAWPFQLALPSCTQGILNSAIIWSCPDIKEHIWHALTVFLASESHIFIHTSRTYTLKAIASGYQYQCLVLLWICCFMHACMPLILFIAGISVRMSNNLFISANILTQRIVILWTECQTDVIEMIIRFLIWIQADCIIVTSSAKRWLIEGQMSYVLFISYKCVKGFLAITFLLLLILNYFSHRVSENQYLRTVKSNRHFILIGLFRKTS